MGWSPLFAKRSNNLRKVYPKLWVGPIHHGSLFYAEAFTVLSVFAAAITGIAYLVSPDCYSVSLLEGSLGKHVRWPSVELRHPNPRQSSTAYQDPDRIPQAELRHSSRKTMVTFADASASYQLCPARGLAPTPGSIPPANAATLQDSYQIFGRSSRSTLP
jgi:hypothetical protein